jgi:GNAT superfamily N-acetyltransferase
VLREAGLEDASELAALFLASRREALPYLPALHTDEETHRWMREVVLPSCRVWVVTEDERLTGFLALAGDQVEHLYVLPGCQVRGVGGSLLAVAKAASPDRLSLYTFQPNTQARAFYERKGFRTIAFG